MLYHLNASKNWYFSPETSPSENLPISLKSFSLQKQNKGDFKYYGLAVPFSFYTEALSYIRLNYILRLRWYVFHEVLLATGSQRICRYPYDAVFCVLPLWGQIPPSVASLFAHSRQWGTPWTDQSAFQWSFDALRSLQRSSFHWCLPESCFDWSAAEQWLWVGHEARSFAVSGAPVRGHLLQELGLQFIKYGLRPLHHPVL